MYKNRIFGLDVVRAVAIVLVVLSHLNYLFGFENELIIALSGLFGYLGVELFFVLSGFLIGSIVLKLYETTSFEFSVVLGFLKRRWFRTLPNYYLILFLNLVIASFFHFDLTSYKSYFVFLQNFSNYKMHFFHESWSLSVEEWAYLFVPVALFCAFKIRFLSKKNTFLATVFLLIIGFHWVRYLGYLENPVSDLEVWNTHVKSIVIYRIDSILFGFVIAWVVYYFSFFLKKHKIGLLFLAFTFFVFQFVLFNQLGFSINQTPVYYHVFYFSFTSLMLSLALPFFVFWENSKYCNGFVYFLSTTSYSVYLIHYSIVAFLMKYLITTYDWQLPHFVVLVGYVFCTFGLASLLYNFYEKPMTNLRELPFFVDKK